MTEVEQTILDKLQRQQQPQEIKNNVLCENNVYMMEKWILATRVDKEWLIMKEFVRNKGSKESTVWTVK